jgi:hypothetical protein
MKKRGEIQSQVFIYILIILFVAMLFLFGYSAIEKLTELFCKSDHVKFKSDLEKTKGIEAGSRKEFTFRLPCKADKTFFVDRDKMITPSHVEDTLLRHSFTGMDDNTLYLTKDNSFFQSYKALNYEIPYPYYECLVRQNGRINFFLEGLGNKALLTPGCRQNVCTRIPINITLEDARKILVEFAELPSCKACPKLSDLPEFDKHVNSFYLLATKANLYRRFRYCPETRLTTVEIIIIPRKNENLEDVAYYEFIPKDCVTELRPILERIFGENTGVYVTIKDDPLIVWHLNEIKKETIIGYEIEQKLTNECREALEGLGIMDICEKKGGCKFPACKEATDCGVDKFHGDPYCSVNNDPSKLFRDFSKHKCSDRGGCEAFIAPREYQDCGTDYCEPVVNACRGNTLITSQTCHSRGCRADACFDVPYTQEGVIENCAYGCSGGSCNPTAAPTGRGGTGDAGGDTGTVGGNTGGNGGTPTAGGTPGGSTTDGTSPDDSTSADSTTQDGTGADTTSPPPDPTGCEYNNPPCPGGYECIGNICFLQIGEGEGDTEDRGGNEGTGDTETEGQQGGSKL